MYTEHSYILGHSYLYVLNVFNYLLHVLIVYSTGVQVVHYLKTCSLVNSKVRYVFLFLFLFLFYSTVRVPGYL